MSPSSCVRKSDRPDIAQCSPAAKCCTAPEAIGRLLRFHFFAVRTLSEPASARLLLVPIHPLAPLVHLLRLEAEGRYWAGVEPCDTDRIAGFLAITVGAVLDTLQGRVDLGDQLTLAIPGPKLKCPVALGRGPIGHIRMVLTFFLKIIQRFAAVAKDLFLPPFELGAEILALSGIHERFGFGRPVFDSGDRSFHG